VAAACFCKRTRTLQVNATQSGADSMVTATCMKSEQDWMALGNARGSESRFSACPLAAGLP